MFVHHNMTACHFEFHKWIIIFLNETHTHNSITYRTYHIVRSEARGLVKQKPESMNSFD